MVLYFALRGKIMVTSEQIIKKLAEAAHKDTIDPSLNFKELGLDSLDVVELLLQLEEEYDIHFDDVDMSGIVTVQDLVNVIEKLSK